jgi:hypothetical protein
MEQAAQQYHRAYPYAGAAAAWDAGAAGVAAATTGAAIGSAAAATVGAPTIAAAATAHAAYAAQPCANAVSVPVGPLTFFRCGTAWYRQAYGPAGPTFVQVVRPSL